MGREREAFCEQLLEHYVHLIDARHPGFIRFSLDIELIGIGPCGRADDLLRMHVISELDQVVEGSVQSVEYAAWI